MRVSTLWAAPGGSQRPIGENKQNEIMDMKYFVGCKSVYTSRVIVGRVFCIFSCLPPLFWLGKMNFSSVTVNDLRDFRCSPLAE